MRSAGGRALHVQEASKGCCKAELRTDKLQAIGRPLSIESVALADGSNSSEDRFIGQSDILGSERSDHSDPLEDEEF